MGVNTVADKVRDELDDIASAIDGGGLARPERSRLNKRAYALRQQLEWLVTRAGYVPDTEQFSTSLK